MQSQYAKEYERLWGEHWWWQARKRLVLGKLRRLARQQALTDILDIGCGNGLFFEELSSFGNVRGIEPDAGLVSEEGRWRKQIEVGPFGAEYQTDRKFDLVLMLDVLEHIEDHAGAARRVHELLKPGGLYLVTVPALRWLWSMHDVINQHHRRYTRGMLRAVLEEAGFEVLELRYFFGWVVGPMALRRMLKPGGGKVEEYKVEVPGGLVNRAMYTVSMLEQVATGWCGVPVGSSVLAVGRKR